MVRRRHDWISDRTRCEAIRAIPEERVRARIRVAPFLHSGDIGDIPETWVTLSRTRRGDAPSSSAANGQKFLVNTIVGDSDNAPLDVELGCWFEKVSWTTDRFVANDPARRRTPALDHSGPGHLRAALADDGTQGFSDALVDQEVVETVLGCGPVGAESLSVCAHQICHGEHFSGRASGLEIVPGTDLGPGDGRPIQSNELAVHVQILPSAKFVGCATAELHAEGGIRTANLKPPHGAASSSGHWGMQSTPNGIRSQERSSRRSTNDEF